MKNKLKSKLMLYVFLILKIVVVLILIVVTGGIISHYAVCTPTFKEDDGETVYGSIAEFDRITLGGHSHGILIRGRNLENPMVVFLHAGPGLSETGMMRNMNAALEDHFTMVYFDQRGASKSYSPFMNFKTFNTSQLVKDIHELTMYLKKRFGKNKIIIMGHSFGAGFGALAAANYSEDYAAFIGIGQPVNVTEIDRLSYTWTVEQSRKTNNTKALKELGKVNNYWLKRDKNGYFQGMMVNKRWVGYYGGQLYGQHGFLSYVLRNSFCKEFTIFDYPSYLLGMARSGPASWEIMISTDLKKQATEFRCPFILFTGRNDYNAVPAIIEDYYNVVKAPLKKQYWFEKSAHFPHLEEKELFQKIMIGEVLPLVKEN